MPIKEQMIDPTSDLWLDGISNEDVLNGLRCPYLTRRVYDGELNDWRLIPEYTDRFRLTGELMVRSAAKFVELNGFLNKVLSMRVVRPGEVIRYDKDRDMTSYIVGENNTIEERREGHYVYPEEAEYSVYPSIKAGEFLKDLGPTGEELARIQLKAANSMQFQQDKDLIALLTRAGEGNKVIEINPVEILVSLIHEMQSRKLECDSILLNHEDAVYFAENKDKFPGLDLYSSDLMSGLREVGCFAIYGDAKLFIQSDNMVEALRNEENNDLIPKGTMIAVAPSEYLGGAPVRIDWMSEPVEEQMDGHRVFGWFWYRLLSMLVINPKAVVLGKIKH